MNHLSSNIEPSSEPIPLDDSVPHVEPRNKDETLPNEALVTHEDKVLPSSGEADADVPSESVEPIAGESPAIGSEVSSQEKRGLIPEQKDEVKSHSVDETLPRDSSVPHAETVLPSSEETPTDVAVDHEAPPESNLHESVETPAAAEAPVQQNEDVSAEEVKPNETVVPEVEEDKSHPADVPEPSGKCHKCNFRIAYRASYVLYTIETMPVSDPFNTEGARVKGDDTNGASSLDHHGESVPFSVNQVPSTEEALPHEESQDPSEPVDAYTEESHASAVTEQGGAPAVHEASDAQEVSEVQTKNDAEPSGKCCDSLSLVVSQRVTL